MGQGNGVPYHRQIAVCFSDADNRVLLKQVLIGIINISLDGVPLIAVLNMPSGFHFSLTCFSVTVIINILKRGCPEYGLLCLLAKFQGSGSSFFIFVYEPNYERIKPERRQ